MPARTGAAMGPHIIGRFDGECKSTSATRIRKDCGERRLEQWSGYAPGGVFPDGLGFGQDHHGPRAAHRFFFLAVRPGPKSGGQCRGGGRGRGVPRARPRSPVGSEKDPPSCRSRLSRRHRAVPLFFAGMHQGHERVAVGVPIHVLARARRNQRRSGSPSGRSAGLPLKKLRTAQSRDFSRRKAIMPLAETGKSRRSSP